MIFGPTTPRDPKKTEMSTFLSPWKSNGFVGGRAGETKMTDSTRYQIPLTILVLTLLTLAYLLFATFRFSLSHRNATNQTWIKPMNPTGRAADETQNKRKELITEKEGGLKKQLRACQGSR